MKNSINAKYIAKGMEEIFKGSRGRVHSIYGSAINLVFGERIVTLLSEKRSILPYSIVLERDFRKIFLELPEHAPVFADNEGLEFPDFSIRISPAITVSLDIIESIGSLERPEDMKTRLRKFADSIHGIGKREGLSVLLCKETLPYHIRSEYFPNIWSEFLGERIERLIYALESLPSKADPDLFVRWGESLAGCGPGLSPASDDFLTGIFAGLYGKSLSGELSLSAADAVCKSIAAGAIPKTNFISAQFLRQSGMERMFAADVIHLIKVIYEEDERNIAKHVLRVSEFGSTSGNDIMTGIYFALSLGNLPRY